MESRITEMLLFYLPAHFSVIKKKLFVSLPARAFLPGLLAQRSLQGEESLTHSTCLMS